jgi:hypothetical protein
MKLHALSLIQRYFYVDAAASIKRLFLTVQLCSKKIYVKPEYRFRLSSILPP